MSLIGVLGFILEAILGSFHRKLTPAELDIRLTEMATHFSEHLNWHTSIVDLLKLVGHDSSIGARHRLAVELGYTGSAADGSEEKNMWLHAEVMKRLLSE